MDALKPHAGILPGIVEQRPVPVTAPQPNTSTLLAASRFELRHPSPQTAIDIFSGRWTSSLHDALPGAVSGTVPLFADRRVASAAEHLGRAGGFAGYSILELGPLEGGHSYQLEKLGAASVVAIEANVESYLKCLVVKEVLGLSRTRFLLGDFAEFLAATSDRFDLVFACGVIYHMVDPLDLIRHICCSTNQCFVWSHYYEAERCPGRTPRPTEVDGFKATYYAKTYPAGAHIGGNRSEASWIEKSVLLDAFRHFGLNKITTIEEQPDHPSGPAMSFAAHRG